MTMVFPPVCPCSHISFVPHLQPCISYGISMIMNDFATLSLRVDRNDIFYVRFILEGYDGLGIVSTKDPAQGQLIVTYPACSRLEVFDLMKALEEEGVVREVA